MITQKSFSEDIGHSLVLEMNETWFGTCNFKSEGEWDQQANQMIELFAQSGHPIFRVCSALNRGTLEAKIRKKHYSHDSEQYTYRAHVFLMRIFVSVLVPACCHSCPGTYSHIVTHWLHAPRGLRDHGAHCLCLAPKHSHFIAQCHMLHLTWLHRARSLLIFDTVLLTCPTSTSQRA